MGLDIQELEQAALKAMMDDGPLAAMELFYRAYEEAVSEVRAAREKSEASVGTKKVLEELTFTATEEEEAQNAMQNVREVIFETVGINPRLSILLYDALRDYASDEVKDFRDDVIRQEKKNLSLPEADESDVPEVTITSDELKTLRERSEAFWIVAGKQELSPSKKELEEDPNAPKTKPRKDGSISLAFSNLPKGTAETSEGTPDSKGVTHSRLRYSVDGTELPPNTPLSAVGLWYLSSSDWTITVEEVKRAVKEQTGQEYKDVEDFSIEINGHTLSRRREQL